MVERIKEFQVFREQKMPNALQELAVESCQDVAQWKKVEKEKKKMRKGKRRRWRPCG